MGLHLFTLLLEYGLLLWLGAVGLAVLYRLLRGDMIVTGLLAKDSSGTHEATPERAQLMAVTIGAAAFYIYQAINAVHGGAKALPDVPENLLLIFGGSNIIYLAGKLSRSTR